jgi:hypothetical protein
MTVFPQAALNAAMKLLPFGEDTIHGPRQTSPRGRSLLIQKSKLRCHYLSRDIERQLEKCGHTTPRGTRIKFVYQCIISLNNRELFLVHCASYGIIGLSQLNSAPEEGR